MLLIFCLMSKNILEYEKLEKCLVELEPYDIYSLRFFAVSGGILH